MPSPDVTYGGVDIYSCSFFSGGVRNTFEYSYMKCLYNKPNLTSKHGLKCIRITSTGILNLKIFSGEIASTPLSVRGKIPPSRALPLRTSQNAYGVQWPYHFSKPDDSPVLLAVNIGHEGHWSFRPITISAHDHFGPYHFGP